MKRGSFSWLVLNTLSLLLVVSLFSCSGIRMEELESGIDVSGFDEAVRPQDDFNLCVNGAWLENTSIPADKTTWGSFAILNEEAEKNQRAIIEELSGQGDLEEGTDEQRVGDFFASFMETAKLDELGVAPIQDDLDAIFAAGTIKELVQLNASQSIEGVGSPLGVTVFPALGDSTRYMVYLFQSGLTLPDRDYYLKDGEKFEAVRAELPGYGATLFELAGVDDAEKRGGVVLDLETRIAEPQWPAEETRDVRKLYNVFDIADLSSASEKIEWPAYLASSGLTDLEDIVIAQPSYVAALGELFEGASLEDWRTYFAFRLLDAAAPYLSDDFVQARFAFRGKLVAGLEEIPPRWQRGVRNVNQLIGEAVGKVYVARHFPPESKSRMEELVNNLIDAFGEGIDELDWMTDETKARAQEKREKFTYKIGYPDLWRDYSLLSIVRDDLIGNIKRANRFEYQRNINKLGGPIDRTEWGMTPQTVNAYHNPTMNEIVFPAAILQPPFFNPAADEAVNYGAIGAVIGHEMGHAFDDQGRRFDGDGNLNDWWTEEDSAAYDERSAKLVEQYDAFEALPDLHVNGQLTLGENIGDLTGVTIGYRAYVKSLGGVEAPVIDGRTGAERFFFGYAQVWRAKYREEILRQRLVADPHSPPDFRVIGPLRNSPDFYETFGVQEGDAMWLEPEERVKIW